MSVQTGTNIKKNHLPVFEEYPEVTGFFSLKDGAVEGSPYNNPDMFRQLGLEDTVRVWPTQILFRIVPSLYSVPIKRLTKAARRIPIKAA